jgi:hypothetical protein
MLGVVAWCHARVWRLDYTGHCRLMVVELDPVGPLTAAGPVISRWLPCQYPASRCTAPTPSQIRGPDGHSEGLT